MFYTKISKKQIGVFFANYKNGNLKIDDDMIKWLYSDIADFGGYNDNSSREDIQMRVKSALEQVFDGKYEEAASGLKTAYTLFNAIYA